MLSGKVNEFPEIKYLKDTRLVDLDIFNLSQIFKIWHKDIFCVLLHQTTLDNNSKIGLNVVSSFFLLPYETQRLVRSLPFVIFL